MENIGGQSGKFHPSAEQTAELAEYEAFKFGVFVHFNMQQFIYTKDEFTQASDPALWDPSQLDVEQWFRGWREAGVRYAVLTVRHTSDFCLWDTKTTDKNVMNSPVPVDIVEEFVSCARKYDIRPCFYYCMWGGAYNYQENAAEVMMDQLDELLTNYGDICLMWMDMANWRPEGITVQQVYDFIKERQPHVLVHFNQHIQDGTKLQYFPTDIVNGEERIPPESGHIKIREVEGKDYYLPFEYEICLQKVDEDVGKGYTRGTRWFTYSEGPKGMKASHPAPVRELYPYIDRALSRGAGNVLISTAPDHTGRVRGEDIGALCQIRDLMVHKAAAIIKEGSMLQELRMMGSEKGTGAVFMKIHMNEYRQAAALGRYFAAGDQEECLLILLDAVGEELFRTVCKPENPCDMLGFRYGACQNPVLLEKGKDYMLVCEQDSWNHYTDAVCETAGAVTVMEGIPLLNLVFADGQREGIY